MMPTIELWEFVGFGLIVEYPTGILYSNQTGGYSCLHPSVEGALVPLRNDCSESWELLSPERKLRAFFEGPKHKGAGATRGLDAKDADFIDETLGEFRLSHSIRVDRARLSESHESWVHVVLLQDEDDALPVFRGLAPYPRRGVLTWDNSD